MGLIAIPLIPAGLAALGKAVAFVGSAAATAYGVHRGINYAASKMAEADSLASETLNDEEGAEAGPCDGDCGETTVPEDPEDLKEQGFEEEPTRAPNRRRFRNPETGEVIEFDRGQPGANGWRGRDHYHRPNPNPTGRGTEYLDRYGNPTPRGSGPSHIPPGTTLGTGGSVS